MFWLDRRRQQAAAEEWPTEESRAPAQQPAPRVGSPHVVISGRQLREEILSYGPAFLHPEDFPEPDAFRALVTVLAAYSLGSRTASRLVRERQEADPTWQPPSRREAMQVVSSLNRLRQYMPYLLGPRAGGATPPASVPPRHTTNRRPAVEPTPPPGRSTRPGVQIAPVPPTAPQPVVNTRPPPPKSSDVLVRPVISVNKR